MLVGFKTRFCETAILHTVLMFQGSYGLAEESARILRELDIADRPKPESVLKELLKRQQKSEIDFWYGTFECEGASLSGAVSCGLLS